MTEGIEILIIEDEEIWLKSLSANLTDFGYAVAGTADTFEQAVTLLNTCNYDIVLLDINLNGKNSGIELGKMVSSLYKKPFIFITANTDTNIISAAVQANPSAYLVKPVTPASLIVTIQSAINNYNNGVVAKTANPPAEDEPFFFVKQGNKYKKLLWTDVIYMRSEKNYTCICNLPDKEEYFIRSTMPQTLQYILPREFRNKFIQINRSESIQLSYIRELSGDEVKTTIKTFFVTESYVKELKKQLHLIA